MADLRARDDASLLAERDRSRAAFRVFYKRHVEALIRYFARRGVDPHDASDLVQETFVAALEARWTYRSQDGPPRAWLFGIARNKLADRGRRWYRDEEIVTSVKAHMPPLTELDLDAYTRIAADDPAIQALDALPEDQRAAVRAKLIEDQDYKEIAAAQGISESNARQRVSRGRRLLRSLLREESE